MIWFMLYACNFYFRVYDIKIFVISTILELFVCEYIYLIKRYLLNKEAHEMKIVSFIQQVSFAGLINLG